MKTKIILFLLCFASLSVMGQGTITREKCKTCGKAIAQCQHKGKHPKCVDCDKVIENCQYNGKHPKCADCGRTTDKCNYKGKHPKCSDCGKSLDKCKYKGKHPAPEKTCGTCGKVLSKCQYKGKHPAPEKTCGTCGKVLSKCQYKGKHPAPEKTCNTCGKALSKCKYKGKHPAPERTCNTCGKALSKCQFNGKHPAPEEAGYDVTFTCNVSSATLYVDGEAYGKASGTRFLKTGEHTIQVFEGGYNDYSEKIIVNRQNTSFTIDLTLDLYVIAKPTPAPVVTSGTINGHEWVDLGLSVKWATCNIGAIDPCDFGGYYAWGETRTKSSYDWSNCFDFLDSTGDSWGTYKLGGQTRITPSSGHDTARENWGGTWRMPTDAENDELCKKCKWTWTSKNGHNGYVVTGPNGNSIFLPAAGCRGGTDSYGVGENGHYWSSTLSSSNSYYARGLYFSSSCRDTNYDGRRYGLSVRPVTE